MRTIYTGLAITALILTQVTNTLVHIPVTALVSVKKTEAAGTTSHEIKLNTKTQRALEVLSTTQSFDEVVLKPLKAKQAEIAAEAAKKQAARIVLASVQKATPIIIGGDDAFAQLRFCEAGGDYAKNTGNGFYGAYQYNLGTWSNYGGFARPDLAPPGVQDAKARETQAARGWSPWPGCSRKLGLL